jgi:hypothetical protein
MKGSRRAAHVLCLLLLAGSPALAFHGVGFSGGMHFGGFGGGMQFGGGRFGTASGFHGGFGPAFHGPRFVGRSFVTNPGVFHGGFDHFHGYLDHIVGRGVDLVAAACERDLEGVVAKWPDSPYWLLVGRSPWVKVKNRAYSQVVGREERFEAWESVT